MAQAAKHLSISGCSVFDPGQRQSGNISSHHLQIGFEDHSAFFKMSIRYKNGMNLRLATLSPSAVG